jgi:hypothetical protein
MPRRAPALATLSLLAGLAAAAGCGEAFVSFQGSVVEGAVTGHAFEPAPAAGPPIAGAVVELCIDSCTREVITAADGSYPRIGTGFAGSIGSDTPIAVRVTAPDGRTAEYATIYEDSDDPLTADPACDGCAPVFLNFTLAPL